jgi:guanyl-specific ribonuclease Sa
VKQLTRIVLASLAAIFLMLLTSGVASARTAAGIEDLASAHVSASALAHRACPIVENPNVPAAAFNVFSWLLTHNYSPPPGYQGNSVYDNSNGKLPSPPSGYRWFEYRVTKGPYTQERIVTARNKKAVGNGYPYYTPDHYNTFRSMFLCS